MDCDSFEEKAPMMVTSRSTPFNKRWIATIVQGMEKPVCKSRSTPFNKRWIAT